MIEEIDENTNNVYKAFNEIPEEIKRFNIMPVLPNNKHPGEWKIYQTQRYDIEEWALDQTRYYNDNYQWNFCVICGAISDNLEIIDIEDYQIYEKFFGDMDTFVVRTPNGGVHMYFISENPLESSSAKYLDFWPIDIRTNKGLIIIPPSKVDGKSYEVLKDLPITKIKGNVIQILENRLPCIKKHENAEGFDLKEFKKQIKINDVVSKYTKPEKRIKNGWQGICPFHNEDKPSLTVFEDTNSWYCFGCSEGGDSIAFIERKENLGFKDAVEYLAKEFGIKFDRSSLKANDKNHKNNIFSIVEYELNRHPSNQLFIGDNKDAYLWLADERGNNRICRKMSEEDFYLWLLELSHRKSGNWSRDCSVKEVSLSLKALAKSITEKKALKTKIDTFYQIGKIGDAQWYDLGREDWLGVEVTSEGWNVKSLPVGFIRSESAKEQVQPTSGGNLDDIFESVNIADKDDRILYKADLITSFIHGVEHPVSYFVGNKGSAKSTATKITVDMVNPIDLNKDLLSWPSDKEALGLALNDSASEGFDNITSINQKFSDTICMAVTGGKNQKRALYTNGGKFSTIYRAKMVLNGINLAGLNFPDLMDRIVVYELESPMNKKAREVVLSEYKERKAKLLGAIFDHISKSMKIVNEVREQDLDLPRLAGFAIWGEAIAQSNWDMQPGEFTKIYNSKRNELSEETVRNDEFANILLQMMQGDFDVSQTMFKLPCVTKEDGCNSWKGTATQLLEFLNEIVKQKGYFTSGFWPKRAERVGTEINKVKKDLEIMGLSITKKKSGDRKISMKYKFLENYNTNNGGCEGAKAT